jgi:hypothetical protein
MSEKIKLGCSESIKSLGFCPSEKSLLSKSIKDLKALYMTKMCYDHSGCLMRLTFAFSNGLRSPPKHSYCQEPASSLDLPPTVGAIHFSCNNEPNLISLGIENRANKLLTECAGSWPIMYTEKMSLLENEHIVSADVEIRDGGAFT